MKNLLLLTVIIASFIMVGNAQTAMQIQGLDCYGNSVDMFADLDAGKAIILHFFMPDCGSCPPPAKKIQTMADDILINYPGMIKAYAFPFQNSTDCDYSISWVEDNLLPLYAPMDSGATPVAYYGGFGMPTVVLLGGTDHRIMFSTQSFVNSDTTEMADSILALFGEKTSVINIPSIIADLNLLPNPANNQLEVKANLLENGAIKMELINITGKVILVNEIKYVPTGEFVERIDTNPFESGLYMLRFTAGTTTISMQYVISH